MKKHIAAAIAAINSLLVVGICGAIECDTMPLGKAFAVCLICSAIAIVSAKVVRDEEQASIRYIVSPRLLSRPASPCRGGGAMCVQGDYRRMKSFKASSIESANIAHSSISYGFSFVAIRNGTRQSFLLDGIAACSRD